MQAPSRASRRTTPSLAVIVTPRSPQPDSASWQHVAHRFFPRHAEVFLPRRRPSDVTDDQWAQIAPYLQVTRPKIGRPLSDQRQILNGILFVLTQRCAWRHLPSDYGTYVTCWRRLLRWQNTGVWVRIERILAATQHPLMYRATLADNQSLPQE